MSTFHAQNISGFYSFPQPVCAGEEAAAFAGRDRLFRLDRENQVLWTPLDAPVSHMAQGEEGILALEWRPGGVAALLTYGHDLRLRERRKVFPLEERARRDMWALSDRRVCRITFPGYHEVGLGDVILLDCWDLPVAESRRFAVTTGDLQWLLGHWTEVQGFYRDDFQDACLWLHGDEAIISVQFDSAPDPFTGETCRSAMIRVDLLEGKTELLWCDNMYNMAPDPDACRPCFFDFDRNRMWTRPRKEPEAGVLGGEKALTPRELARDCFILENGPVWEDVEEGTDYFDGQHAYRLVPGSLRPAARPELWTVYPSGRRARYRLPPELDPDVNAPLVYWQDSLVMIPERGDFPVLLDWEPNGKEEDSWLEPRCTQAP